MKSPFLSLFLAFFLIGVVRSDEKAPAGDANSINDLNGNKSKLSWDDLLEKPKPGENESQKEEAGGNDVGKQLEYLQDNFSKFVPIEFEPPKQNGRFQEAVIHRLHVKGNMFQVGNKYNCGFRFTLPKWLDGDLQWCFLLVTTDAEEDHGPLDWGFIPEKGRIERILEGYHIYDLDPGTPLKRQFPYNKHYVYQILPKEKLKPGGAYALWFRFEDKDFDDIAFVMRIASERGRKEFGIFPLESETLIQPGNIQPVIIQPKADSPGRTFSPEVDKGVQLLEAATKGDCAQMKSLIEEGVDFQGVGNVAGTPLLMAIVGNQIKVVDLLIEKGVNPYVYPWRDSGSTLVSAIHMGRTEIVRKLLDYGMDANFHPDPRANITQGPKPDVPLVVATRDDRREMVKLLLDHGAKVDEPDQQGITALAYAEHDFQPEIAEMLKKSGAKAVDTKILKTLPNPLFRATETCNLERIKFLIGKGLDVRQCDQAGNSLLVQALIQARRPWLANDAGMIAQYYILISGLDVNKGFKGDSPLYLAVITNKYELVSLILQKHGDPNAESLMGSTPLIAAVSSGNAAMVKLLVQAGAKVDAAEKSGRTPLSITRDMGNKEIEDILVLPGNSRQTK